jgi:hypothetical protein
MSFGDCKEGRGDGACGVDYGFEMGVVVVIDVGGDAVDEGGDLGVCEALRD